MSNTGFRKPARAAERRATSADAWAEQAERVEVPGAKPWDTAHPKVVVPFQARFPERLHRKLAWVAVTEGGSMQEHLLAALEAYVERTIEAQQADPALAERAQKRWDTREEK